MRCLQFFIRDFMEIVKENLCHIKTVGSQMKKMSHSDKKKTRVRFIRAER